MGTIDWNAIEQIMPPHKGGMSIEKDPHRANYESVEEYERWRGESDDWVSPEEREKAIETDTLWTIQWYPDTPVGFCYLMASSLEALMSRFASPAPDTEGGEG